MRRSKQQIPTEEVKQILTTATNGVLSLVDSKGNPYGVPMSFFFNGSNYIYFHCALTGKKIDCIINKSDCCFTVVDQDEIHPDEFTTYFRSVIAEGSITIISDKEEMITALKLLASKYSPGIDCAPEISKGINRVLILKMDIKSMTGKEAIEITKQRIYNKSNPYL